jgi:hypothetical protein
MTADTGAASTTEGALFLPPLAPASRQSEQSFAGRLINAMLWGRKCNGDQYIPDHLRSQQEQYQNEFRVEFERRLLGQ